MSDSDSIKQRLPIDQVIGSYVPLKRMGRIYKACCPFHQEKTPSFSVSPDRGIYKCFGCGKGGDIFDFVMEYEGLTFPEALQLLADKAGVTLTEREKTGGRANGQRRDGIGKDRIFAVNQYAAKLWNTILTDHPKAQPARDYLAKRGLTPKTIAELQIGYAPLGAATAQTMQKAGFSIAELQAAGDPTKFQDRITFPICDITGRVIGFTGRLLETPEDPPGKRERGPKYWNTPETPVFLKSKAVFNLHLAKHTIQEKNIALLAEGQMDVAMLYQYGYLQAIASSGTALTVEQLQIISRFSTTICFAYDQDKAGIEATKRGIELALQLELNPFVVVIPDGKDPADCLRNDAPAWEQAYTNRHPFMEWLIRQILPPDGHTLSPIEKKEAARTLLPWLSRILDPIEQADWRRKVAAHLQTDEQNLIAAIARLQPQRSNQPQPTYHEAAPASESEQVDSPASFVQQQAELIASLLLANSNLVTLAPEALSIIRDGIATPFLNEAIPVIDQGGLASLEGEAEKKLTIVIEERLRSYNERTLTEAEVLSEVLFLTGRLRSERKESAKSDLAHQISQAQSRGDSELVKQLVGKLQQLL